MTKRNIFLVGMPSSGKSTLGKQLAEQLKYQFVDMDQLIVDDQQLTIPEIFSRFGEGYFREVESRILKQIPVASGLLVATGGGAPCFFDNMDYILENGYSVFLDVEVSELAARIRAHAVDDRPLLSGLTDLEAELKEKLEHRRQFYSRAHITITPDVDLKSFIASVSEQLESEN